MPLPPISGVGVWVGSRPTSTTHPPLNVPPHKKVGKGRSVRAVVCKFNTEALEDMGVGAGSVGGV